MEGRVDQSENCSNPNPAETDSDSARSITRRAYARVGLLGNPSDGYNGKTLSFSLANFFAEVTLQPSRTIRIKPCAGGDIAEFASLSDLAEQSNQQRLEHADGGVCLLVSLCACVHDYCQQHGVDLPQHAAFTLSYSTNIPRQVGLSGSSAIITAALSCLLHHCHLHRAIPVPVRPNLILEAESRLGIAAGLQDRVIQTYGGLVFMSHFLPARPDCAHAAFSYPTPQEFKRTHLETHGYGMYQPMDPALLPPLQIIFFLAYTITGPLTVSFCCLLLTPQDFNQPHLEAHGYGVYQPMDPASPAFSPHTLLFLPPHLQDFNQPHLEAHGYGVYQPMDPASPAYSPHTLLFLPPHLQDFNQPHLEAHGYGVYQPMDPASPAFSPHTLLFLPPHLQDFNQPHLEAHGYGVYQPMDPALLPPLQIIFAANPSDSGHVHSSVRARWQAGDVAVRQAMADVATLAKEGQNALVARDWGKLARLMDRNFDLRRQMFGDEVLGEVNLSMVQAARAVGAAAKFTGSGGAVVAFCPEGEQQRARLEEACREKGFCVVDALVAAAEDVEVDALVAAAEDVEVDALVAAAEDVEVDALVAAAEDVEVDALVAAAEDVEVDALVAAAEDVEVDAAVQLD
ncbi:unnamed protein product [Closterium sp. NIES-53]